MSYISTWSGGKDSCLAYFLADKEGYNVKCLLNFISNKTKRVKFHGIQGDLIQKQVKRMNKDLIQKETTWNGYEKNFKYTLEKLNLLKIKGVIFGDIYINDYKIQKHKQWAEKICKDIGIEVIEPLWGRSNEDLIFEFLNLGFKAIIASINPEFIEKEWIGEKLNIEFIEYLKNKKINLCGEKGEYHTFVIDGPIFSKKIQIKKHNIFFQDGYWMINILKYC